MLYKQVSSFTMSRRMGQEGVVVIGQRRRTAMTAAAAAPPLLPPGRAIFGNVVQGGATGGARQDMPLSLSWQQQRFLPSSSHGRRSLESQSTTRNNNNNNNNSPIMGRRFSSTTTTAAAAAMRKNSDSSSPTTATALLQSLRQALDDASIAYTDNSYECTRHGQGESYHQSTVPPTLVVWPQSTAHVQTIVQQCIQRRIVMIPFGAGTSVEGQLVNHTGPQSNGGVVVSIDLSHMNQILHLPDMKASDDDNDMPPDPYVIVEAGVTRTQLQAALRSTGYQFPVDPGAATATLGGMVATGAAGTTTVKYGTMREHLLGLTCVMASDVTAPIVHTGCRTRKNSAGYDVRSLLCGSEGTLGIVTQMTLRVWPVPAATIAGRATFPSLMAAARAVALITASGVDLVRCELLDPASVEAFNTYNRQQSQDNQSTTTPELPLVPTLFLELQGASDTILQEQVAMVTELLFQNDSDETDNDKNDNDSSSYNRIEWASDTDARQALWKARHSLYYAAIASRPEATGAMVTDACVPLSHLPYLLEATAQDVKDANLVGPCFGHAGDGSFHCILPVNNEHDTPDYWQRVHMVNDNLLRRTLAVGGTVTGEHGVGSGKRQYLEQQYGPGAVQMMHLIKRALDPYHLLNPGKVLIMPKDDEIAESEDEKV